MKLKKFVRRGRAAVNILLVILVGIAILEQLRRSPEERTWQGSIMGIPYDFRRPTPERLRATFWNENTPQILVPQAFGMGWTINFYPLLHPRAS